MDQNEQLNNSGSGRWFIGVVDSSDSATFLLTISPIDKDLTSFNKVGGLAVSTCFANLFGFKDCSIIQPGSRVLCYKTEPMFCYVIAVLPNNDIGVMDFPNRANLGAGDANSDSSQYQGYGKELAKTVLANMRRPTDTTDADKCISNDYGVMLNLLGMMASLKASELAQVQCHLLDDLVRIISHNFEHYTALGQFKVFHDGQSLMAEFGATGSPTEAMGIAETNQSSTATNFAPTESSSVDDSTDFYKISSNERTTSIERFKLFLGKLGDFFNVFLTRPADGVTPDLSGTQPTAPDTGLLQWRMSVDGGYYLRSVKEIFMEKTNWIRVPQRVFTPEDPNGDDGTKVTFNPKEPYEFDTTFQYQENPFLAYLQLRNYVAYVNEVVAYQNFKSYPKDFVVNDNVNAGTQVNEIENVDPNTPLGLQGYTLRNSGVYLMQNGGLVLKDAYGSAIIMEGGNIYIQPAKDLVLQPLRNLVGKIGQFVSIAAKKDIDFSSTEKGIRFKSALAQYFYSSSSGMVFQSNAQAPSAGTPDPSSNAIENIGGIVFKSNQGIYNFANGTIANITKGDFLVQADQSVRLDGKETAQLSSDQNVTVSGLSSASLISSGTVAVISQDSCLIAGVNSTAIGQKDSDIGVTYDQNNPFIDPIKGALQAGSLYQSFGQTVLKDSQLTQIAEPFTSSTIAKLNFRFLNSSEYNLVPTEDPIPMTMPQQEDDLSGMYDLSEWTEADVDGSLPYPGSTNFNTAFASTTGAIPNLQVYNGYDYTGKPNSTNGKMVVTQGSLNNYKVQEPD
jgi:hypothetical protein